jgi:hypothetical protein
LQLKSVARDACESRIEIEKIIKQAREEAGNNYFYNSELIKSF